MVRTRAMLVLALIAICATPIHVGASVYGSGRFRAVQIRYQDAGIVALVEGYIGEGANLGSDASHPTEPYRLVYVCALVITAEAQRFGCDEGEVTIAWPLLEGAALRARAGDIEIDIAVTERGAPRPSPMAELSFAPPFTHTGVITFRPGAAVGSISSPIGDVSGSSNLVSLYSLTSVYGSPV